ncbi:MAG: glycosyltransferase, partial [Cypionkella sp.]
MLTPRLSVIIPASNEAGYIGACLTALFASGPIGGECIVVANGCHDNTHEVASSFMAIAEASDWSMKLLTIDQGNKPNALNWGDKLTFGQIRVFLDADVIVSPNLMAELIAAL